MARGRAPAPVQAPDLRAKPEPASSPLISPSANLPADAGTSLLLPSVFSPTACFEQELGVIAAYQAAGLRTTVCRRRWFLAWKPISSSPNGEPPQVCGTVFRVCALPDQQILTQTPGHRQVISWCHAKDFGVRFLKWPELPPTRVGQLAPSQTA
jgi:hypothetical protein